MRLLAVQFKTFLAAVTIIVAVGGSPAMAKSCEEIAVAGPDENSIAAQAKDRVLEAILIRAIEGDQAQETVAEDVIQKIRDEYQHASYSRAQFSGRAPADGDFIRVNDEDRLAAARSILWNRPWV